MGISDTQGSCGVDCSVGSIVWVRRRNGSWWPGRILGPNELSASHLMSPRSGTPVKLLGREDASVDWYNLEKSKRVKAFRCGEFDDCIERAESSQSVSIKKREKYARREDAILHALELEKEQLDKKQQKLGVTSNCTGGKLPGVVKQELRTHSENFGSDRCKSQPVFQRLDHSLEDKRMGNPFYAHKAKHGKQLSWVDDNSEVIPRMRGLQDFGLRIAPKRKLSSSVSSESSRRLRSVDNHLLPGHNMGDTNHVGNSSSLAVKRKRSQGGITEESLVKRRDRRRPLVQVLQSSAKLARSHSLQPGSDSVSISMKREKEQTEVIFRAKRSACVYLPSESSKDNTEYPLGQSQISPSHFGMDIDKLQTGSLTDENTSSGLLDDTESDSSDRDSLDPDKIRNERTLPLDASEIQTVAAEPRSLDRCQVIGAIRTISSEELEESAVSGYMSPLHPRNQAASGSADVGVSKWQLKGKRNIRNLTKRPVEVMDEMISNESIHETYLEGKGNSLSQRESEQGFYLRRELHAYDEGNLIDKDVMETKIVGFGNRCLVPSKATYNDYSTMSNDITDSDEDSVWEADGLSQSSLRGYRVNPGECYDPLYVRHSHGNGMESMLVDVDLKVQASYQGEHVPLVSLMSRLNGKAIIGHPIQIEALEPGSSNFLFSTNDDFGNDPLNNDGSSSLPPVWTTGRRTAMLRVPRPHPSSALEGDGVIESLQYSDPENKSSNKKLYDSGQLDLKARLMRKNSNVRRPPKGKRFSRKILKKVGISSQKTRTLSSIAIEQKLRGNGSDLKLAEKGNTNGLIKPEDSGLTTVTCIPVKLVFSRLLEAVGRPPSRAATYGVLMNDVKRQHS